MHNLDTLQEWMQTTLISRGDLDEKLYVAKEKTGLSLDEMIYSKKGVSAYERLDIYASGYVLRLVECMQADYEALQTFLGEELFETFAKAYIVSIPSSSWNLYYLGEGFASFLKDTQPQDDNELFHLPALIAEIERKISESLQAKGIEHQVAKQQKSFFSAFIQDMRIVQVPSLRILRQPYDLKDFFINIVPLFECEIPSQQETYLALSRKDYRVNIHRLEAWQYTFLSLCEKEITLNKAIEKTAFLLDMQASTLRAKVLLWLPVAIDLAFIEDIT